MQKCNHALAVLQQLFFTFLAVNLYSSGQMKVKTYILPIESNLRNENSPQNTSKVLVWTYEKIVITSAHENTDPRAGRKQNQLYIQMTFIYSNYNDFSRFLISSLGIKHDKCIIRPAVLPRSIPFCNRFSSDPSSSRIAFTKK